MENDDGRKQGQSTAEEIRTAPWLDLPHPLTDLILERLPLSYYLRFAAACRRWRSIQGAHRLGHAPGPPPMPQSPPCLFSTSALFGRSSLKCYSPFDQTFPRPHFLPAKGDAACPILCVSSAHGWLLLLPQPQQFQSYTTTTRPFLVNPVSGTRISLPSLSLCVHFVAGALSGPPSSPHCFVLLADPDNIFVLSCPTANIDGSWRKVRVPRRKNPKNLPDNVFSVVSCGGRFYYSSVEPHVYVVDPLLDMLCVKTLDVSLDHPADKIWKGLSNRSNIGKLLVQSDEEVLLLESAIRKNVIVAFRVFKIDLSRNVLTKMEDIGDRTLFVSAKGTFCMLAGDTGCRKNCIYYTCCSSELMIHTCGHKPWKAFRIFDLETNKVIDERPVRGSETCRTKDQNACQANMHNKDEGVNIVVRTIQSSSEKICYTKEVAIVNRFEQVVLFHFEA